MIYIIFGILLASLLWVERGRLIRFSTIKGLQAAGIKNVINLSALHMFIYGRWSTQYVRLLRIFFPRLGTREKERLADSYHCKVVTPEHAKNIITINKNIPLQDLEQVIPYPVARKILLEYPLDVVVIECPCRATAANPCSPSHVCMIIGKPFTDFILDHNPTAKRLTQEEALDLLEEVHKKGCVHTAWFKNACLDRFYAICNCCKCCCLGIKAMVSYGIPIVSPSGYVARIDSKTCIQCGNCKKACPFEAISEHHEVIKEKCMGCDVCAAKCKKNAIVLERDETKGIPLDVRSLSER